MSTDRQSKEAIEALEFACIKQSISKQLGRRSEARGLAVGDGHTNTDYRGHKSVHSTKHL